MRQLAVLFGFECTSYRYFVGCSLAKFMDPNHPIRNEIFVWIRIRKNE
jgi:hypothetical protein